MVALASQGLAPDSEREKKEFVYDLSLATQGIIVSQYNTGVNYSLGLGIHVDMEKASIGFKKLLSRGTQRPPLI